MIYNNTKLTLEDVKKRKMVGKCHNKWRGRNISLYEHNETEVISVGVSFDLKDTFVCVDEKSGHANALAVFPETYVHE